MIIELTKENLQKCGFEEEQIIKLLEWDKYDMFFLKDTCYYATNIEKKIFTEIDGFRKYYLENGTISFPMDCPDLIPNYFDLALKDYLDKQILLLNTMFVETDQKKKFVLNEIEKIKRSIEVLKEDIKIKIYFIRDNKKRQVDILDSYVSFLKNKLDEQSQQIVDEVLLKNNNTDIFENDFGFTLFTKMFEQYKKQKTHLANFSFLFFAI